MVWAVSNIACVLCVLQITATVTAESVCAEMAGQASTATVQPAGTRVRLRMECYAVGVATVSAASVSAETLEPQDPPVNAVLPVATPVTLNGNVSASLFSSVASSPGQLRFE